LPSAAPKKNVGAELDTDGAQHEQPEHHHQGKIESAETGGIELRKSEIQCATGGEQPDFVAVPDRADGAQDFAALLVRLCHGQVDCSGTQIEAVEDHVGGHHHTDNPKPNGCHI